MFLVQGTEMPWEDQLPEDLKEFAYRYAVELTHAHIIRVRQIHAAVMWANVSTVTITQSGSLFDIDPKTKMPV
jgi:hypothetical protein